MMSAMGFDHLCDAELLARVRDAVANERETNAQLIALLSEVDARKLYLSQGCSSLFTYCTQVLHLSEHAAYARIEAARAARKFPVVLERLENGSLTLTAVGLLRPVLTAENHLAVLDAAAHKTKHDLERLVAALRPRPDVPVLMEKLPPLDPTTLAGVAGAAATQIGATAESNGLAPAAGGAIRAAIKPLAPERYRLQLTISGEAHDNLRRLQNLLRHRSPTGDLGMIVENAITLLLEKTLKTKAAITDRARSMCVTSTHTRPVPAAVRRAVWHRDEGRCAFRGALMRCAETGDLEYHHVIPFAVGGATSVDNIELRCRAHNTYEAKEYFG